MAFSFKRARSFPSDPAERIKNCIYLVKEQGKTDFDIYMVDAEGSAFTHFNEKRFKTLFDHYSETNKELFVVSDIAERDAIDSENNFLVFVLDATDDPVIGGGEALYFYIASLLRFVCVYQSKHVQREVDWSKLVNGPNSSASQIDIAVSNTHTHENKNVLDELEVNDNQLHFKGKLVSTVVLVESNW